MTRLAYIGNFSPAHSTENHVARSFEADGHEVIRIQENEPGAFPCVAEEATRQGVDLVLWTRTGWDPRVPEGEQLDALQALDQAGMPTVGFHLDRWWGLDREHQVLDEPFFRSSLVITADGGHDQQWVDAGVNHAWLPPGVFHEEAEQLGQRRARFLSDVAFVGSWRHYHPEWAYRLELVSWLRQTFRSRARFWPHGAAVRGADLADLYASVKVIVGDSCLAPAVDGTPITRYWSDRIPESLGRGGFLIHPWVEGIDDHYVDGEHLRLYPLGDWAELRRLIVHYLRHDDERQRIATAGRAHVLEHHTYRTRARQILELARAAQLA